MKLGAFALVALLGVSCAVAVQTDSELTTLRGNGGTKKYKIINRVGAGDSEPPKNVGYLGAGYDIIFGNPQGDGGGEADPGFREPVLTLEWKDNCPDWEYLCPTGGYARKKTSCNFQSGSKKISSMKDYQSSLNVDVSVEASYDGLVASGSFSASTSYKNTQRNIAKKSSSFFESKALCTTLVAGIDEYTDLNTLLDKDYKAALEKLPTPFNSTDTVARTQYETFFKAFGTHVATEITFGAKKIYTMEVSKESEEQLAEKGVDVSASLSVSAWGGEAGASTSVGSHSSSQDAAKSAVSKVTEINVGGIPTTGDWKDWAASIEDRPMPIQYRLVEHSKLAKGKAKQDALSDAVKFWKEQNAMPETPSQRNPKVANRVWSTVVRKEGDAVTGDHFSSSSKGTGRYQLSYKGGNVDCVPVPIMSQVYPDLGNFGHGGDTRDSSVPTFFDQTKIEVVTGDAEGSLTNRYFSLISVSKKVGSEKNFPSTQMIAQSVMKDGSLADEQVNNVDVKRVETGRYVVTFSEQVQFESTPTVVVTAFHSNTGAGATPDTRTMCIIRGINTEKFEVMCGINGDAKQVGFNFLALGQVPGDSGIIHGVVDAWGAYQNNNGTGFVATRAATGHVKVEFTESFTAIPSVVVTQVGPSLNGFGGGGDTRDHCLLTGIRQTGFSVVCGDNDGNRSDRMFAFVATGN